MAKITELRPFGLLAPKTYKIIWLSNLSTLSVPDQGYSRNASHTLNFKSAFLFHTYQLLSKMENPEKLRIYISKY